VFSAYDASGSGTVSLDDARAAFSQLGMKLTLTEARSLARAQAGGDRGVPHASLTFNYDAFLRGVGATAPRSSHGMEPPRAAGDALATLTSRLEKDRGGERCEGYTIQLRDASPRAAREYPGKRGVRRATATRAASRAPRPQPPSAPPTPPPPPPLPLAPPPSPSPHSRAEPARRPRRPALLPQR